MEQPEKKKQNTVAIVFLVIFAFFIWIFFSGGTNNPSQPAGTTSQNTPSKEVALKEFTRLMDLSKKSGLVKSYEMDENTSLKIFVSNVWYSQEVQFKKDMIAKFSSLEEQIYGRHRLEVLDAYSNEKLAEITAFSGSIEIYK
jgi:phage regulator Rha-like protein